MTFKRTVEALSVFIVLFITIFYSSTGVIAGFKNFITVKNNKLMDGDTVFRFISFNIPNLNFVEDEMAFTKIEAYGLPVEYEIRDALESIKQIGGRVVRIYTIPVRSRNENKDIPKYVLAPGKFNESAFKCLDSVLAAADEMGIRLIIPLVNNWKWMGGRPQYAAFRGKKKSEFWTDPQLINDFKKTIQYILNRKNTITGIKYKEDKAILCWETGNELTAPQSWTHEIVKYIKSIDKNHLVMDGYHGSQLLNRVVEEPLVDIVTTHHYENNPEALFRHIDENIEKIKNSSKAYIIGEFGFSGTLVVRKLLDKVIDNKSIAGCLIWSLRYHRKDGGFYWHSEPLGRGMYKAYHWPGFNSGNEYDEKGLLKLMREKAYAIQGKKRPNLSKPSPPVLLPINNAARISWKGSTGASGYNVESAERKTGPWEIAGFNISDARVQYYPLFYDNSAKIGSTYYYRVIAVNKEGRSLPSNIVGPVKVKTQALIDNMENYMKLYYSEGKLEVRTDNARKFKEDMYRIEAEKGSSLIYWVPGTITNYKIYLFSQENSGILDVYRSADGKKYEKIKSEKDDYSSGKGYYGYWNPILFKSDMKKGNNDAYLKLEFKQKAQISRIEIYYE